MGWGIFEMSLEQALIQVISGKLDLKVLKLRKKRIEAIASIQSNGEIIAYRIDGNQIHFDRPAFLDVNNPLVVVFK